MNAMMWLLRQVKHRAHLARDPRWRLRERYRRAGCIIPDSSVIEATVQM